MSQNLHSPERDFQGLCQHAKKCFLKIAGRLFISSAISPIICQRTQHMHANIRSRRSTNHSPHIRNYSKRQIRKLLCPSPKWRTLSGLFDSPGWNMFAHHEHNHGASIGACRLTRRCQSNTCLYCMHRSRGHAQGMDAACRMRCPQYITFGMSHYYSEPKRVRFQSEGKSIDADSSPPHLPKPPYCRTSAKSSILWRYRR